MLRRHGRLANGGKWLSLPVVGGSQLGSPKMVWSEVVRRYCGPTLVADSLNVAVTRRRLLKCVPTATA